MYDPLRLSESIEKIISKEVNGKVYRKYYRFRPARFYGGIASADCVGCNLRCLYCWSNDLAREGKIGKFYPPEEVSEGLTNIARKFNFRQLRITGNEPTLSKRHLIQVLEDIPSDFTFILETNGILLGNDEDYVKELKKFSNLHVRVSLKGCTEEEFSRLTGATPESFQLQLKALDFCVAHDISCHPAVLVDLVKEKNLEILRKRLKEIDERLAEDLEFENLIPYPHVVERLKQASFRII
ncbi:MAG: radical SAM protein [Candidatus Aenigmarchaeota archaeon]|nr:radical SAM protein [Candidatus Aenigmarchaeota archaeon]